MNNMQNLLSTHWELLLTNGGPQKWLVKFHALEDGYQIAVTDTATVFLETVAKDTMSSRLKASNKLLEAPIARVLQHLADSIKKHHQHSFKSDFNTDGSLTVTLSNNFTVGVPFHWTFECSSQGTEASSVTKQLLCDPIIRGMSRLLFENELLREVIRKKDAEIADYRESGAQVSRAYLQTQPFNHDQFVENMKEMTDYAVVITKDPLQCLGDAEINRNIALAVADSCSSEVQMLSQTTQASPRKPSNLSTSPTKLHATKRRKAKPEHRGAYIDDSVANVQVNLNEGVAGDDVKREEKTTNTNSAKPKTVKRRKKGLF